MKGKHKLVKSKGNKLFTPEGLWDSYLDYLDACRNATIEHPTARGEIVVVNKPRVPTMGGLMAHLNITRECWSIYGSNEGYEDYHDICKRISGLIYERKLDSLVNGDGNTNGLIFDLKVNHGLTEKSILEQNVNGNLSVEFTFE